MTQVTLRVVLFTLAVVVISGFAGSVLGQEQKILAKSVPSAVINAFKSSYPNATIKGFAREKENGKIFYEIESKDGAVGRDVLYNADGSVAEIEETVAASDLPEAIRDSINSKYPNAVITKAEKTIQGENVGYEVIARRGKKRLALEFDANGNLKTK
ncbi:MAG TPA: PepSY-like domain-containing protein [Pyrinomonadaceae bacterium]|jgi:hypothetical protein|nr:PepSY-like domain-containing protein [Pyrinomonadaceae bacterium]